MRTVIRIGVGLVAVLVLTCVGLYFYLTPERLRAMIVPRLSEALDRQVGIGAVSLSFWGGVLAVVDGLEVRERAGFGDTPFITARRTRISIPLWQILTGDGQLGAIAIDTPAVSIVVNADGESSIADLLEDEGQASESAALPITEVALSDARLSYRDEAAGTTSSVSGLDLDVSASLRSGALYVEGDADVNDLALGAADAPFRSGPFGLDFAIGLPAGKVTIDQAVITRNGARVAVTGVVTLDEAVTILDLAVKTDDAPIADLARGHLPDGLDLTGALGLDVRLAGPVPTSDDGSILEHLRGAVTLRDGNVFMTALPEPIRELQAALDLDENAMIVRDLRASVAGSPTTITGSVDRWWKFDQPTFPKADLKVETKTLDVPRLSDTPSASWWDRVSIVTPAFAAVADAAPDLSILKALDVALRLNAETVKLTDRSLGDFKAEFTVVRGAVDIRSARFRTEGSDIGLNGKLDLRNPAFYAADISGTVARLDLALAGPLLTPGSTIAGKTDITFQASGRIDSTLSIPFAANGHRLSNPSITGAIRLHDLRFTSVDLAVPMQIARADLTLQSDDLSSSRVDVKAGKSDFVIGGGVEGLLAHFLVSDTIRPRMKLMVGSTYCDLDEIIPPVPEPAAPASAGWSFVGTAHAAPVVDQTSILFPVVHYADGTAIFDFTTLITDSITVSAVQAHANARAGHLDVKPLAARVYDGRVSGRFQLNATKKAGPYPVQAELDIVQADVNTLLTHALEEPTPIYGKVTMKVGMRGSVDSVFTIGQKDLVVGGGIGMEQGRIVNWGWLKESLKDVQELGFLNFDEIPIRTLQAPFRISEERFHMNEFTLNAADMSCKLSGSYGFDGSLNAILDAWVPAKALNVAGINVGNALSALFGGKTDRRIPMRVYFQGTAEKPKISVEVQPEGWEAFDKKVEEQEEKLYKEAENWIKNWWNN